MPYTIRELVWMADARRRDEWDRAAAICSILINVNSPKGKRVTPDQLNPYTIKPRKKPIKVGIEALKIFLPKR